MKRTIIGVIFCALILGVAAVPAATRAESRNKTGADLEIKISALQKIINQLQSLLSSLTQRQNATSTISHERDDDRLPPGIAKKVEKGKGLPPGILKNIIRGKWHWSGNSSTTATSTTATTTAPTDVTAPSITFLTANSVGSSSARLIWITNEAADSRVWVSTTTPNVSLAPTTSNNSLTYYHDVQLTGLASSTAYLYAVASRDAAGNQSTVATSTFTTTAQ